MSTSLPSWATAAHRVILLGSEEWMILKANELRQSVPDLYTLVYPPEDPERFERILKHPSLFQEERWIYVTISSGEKHLESFLPLLPNDPALHLILACPGATLLPPPGFFLFQEEEDRVFDEDLPAEVREELKRLCEGQPLRRFYLLELLRLAAHPNPPRRSDLLWFFPREGRFDGMRFAQWLSEGNLLKALEEIRAWEQEGGVAATIGRDLLGAVGYRLRALLKDRLRQRFNRVQSGSIYSLEDLRNLLEALKELDRLLKTTTLPASLLLRQFVIGAILPSRR